MFRDKISGIGMKILKIAAQRPESFQAGIGIQNAITIRCPKFSIRKDGRATRFFYEVEIKSQTENSSFDYLQATFYFVVMLKEETNEAEIKEFIKSADVSYRVFLPYMDSFFSGLTKDMGITPFTISASILKQIEESKQEKTQ